MPRDKRTVDELTIEELEQILAIRKREERMKRFRDGQGKDRMMAIPLPTSEIEDTDESDDIPPHALIAPAPSGVVLQQHEASALVPAPSAPTTYDITAEKPHFEDDILQSDEVMFIEEKPKPAPPKNRVVKVTTPEARTQKEKWRVIANRGLLVVEVVAFVGLIYVLYRAFIGLDIIQNNTNKTQQEYEAAVNERRATSTPLPELYPSLLVLPGGHTSDGQFNENELVQALNAKQVPAYIQNNVIQQARFAPVQSAPPSLQDPVSLTIPDLPNVNNASVFSGDDWETLQKGIGHMRGSGLPGSNQNVVLTGHNDIYGEIFRYLSTLELGDLIYLRAADGKEYTYQVVDSREVLPTEIAVLHPDRGAIVTLITCHPYQVDTHRWVVTAELVQ
ncbi:MAG: sortase [Anaerolineae bacterium]|nr:sortase [Anaerolineae bacterium]